MPPRRTTRSADTATRPASSTRSTRSRASAAVLSPVRSEASKGGFPGEDSDSEEEEDLPKPSTVVKKKAPPSRTAPLRRSTRASGNIPSPEPEQREPKAAPKRSNRRKQVVESDSSSEEDLESYVTAPSQRSRSSITQTPSTYHSLPTPPPDSVRASATPEPATENDENVPTPRAPQTPKGKGRADAEDGDRTVRRASPESSPDIPRDLLPPKTPIRAVPLPSMATPAAVVAAPPKPRLVIHKLVLNDFKSYAGRQEIGPFHKSFSAIVGPNGSGKSNTIDALLFVFGFRASKMRQGKLSELIHNSAGKEGLSNCSVEVWFKEIVDLPGMDNYLVVPNSQLVVKRTAFRNNSSTYTINDKSSTHKEITTLLKGKGIDLDHNRFLILQGEVESIALMKPKAQNEHEDGLLEYLEDIIGTAKYKEAIEQASEEVEGLNEERGEKMNRLRVVEREKATLEDKKREAEDYLRDTNELTRKKSLLWQYHMHTLQSNIEITTKAIDQLNAQLSEEQERNAHHLAQIEDLQKGYDAKLADFEEVKRLTDALVKDAKKIEKEEVGLSEKKKHLVTKQKKLKKSVTEDGHARSEALGTVQNCEGQLETNRVKVADLEVKLEAEEKELEEIRDSLKDKTDEFTTKIEAKQRELEPWTAKINEKQSAIDVAQSERDLLAQKATGAQEALEEAHAALQAVRDGDQSKHEEYAALKKEAAKAKKELAESEETLASMQAKSEKLRAKVSTSRQKTDDAKASLAADKSEGAVLASLNKLKAQGRIKGFHGRLGDLGVIDDKYDVAVTTACGALNNLVVDTVEQGQACIEHLRKGNVGRASFMVLEKLPARDLSRIDTPEGVPRLFDLIKPKDPRFAPAFYKGLFNTLVAKDLEQAQRIGFGKKRWRVVTLDGKLIDPSGTMSGGGNRVARGGMSSKFKADKVAPEVVHRYEQELAVAEGDLQAFLSERKALEQQIAQLRKRIPDIEMQMEKIQLDVQTGSKRIAEAEKRIAELSAQSKPDVGDQKRIATLDSEIASLTKEVNKLKEKSGAINDQIKELQNKILEVGGVRLRAIQSKFTTTKGLLDLANEAITKAEVTQAQAERTAQKLEKAIAANKEKLDECDTEIEAVEADLQACSADLAVIQEKVQEAQDATADVQEALAESKSALDEASVEVNAFRKLEVDIKQKLEDNVRLQKDSKDKHRHWAKRHDELELAYIDEDDEEDEEEAEKSPTPEKTAEQPAEQRERGSDDEEEEEEVEVEEEEEEREETPSSPRKKANGSTELVEYSPDELRAVDKDLLNGEIAQLEEDISKAKPNLNVLNEYRRREAEFLDRARDLETVTQNRDAAKQRYDDLRKVRLDEFMAGFSAISAKLKELYQMITMGGNAEIELVDTMDPFSEGVVLSIMPPKKSWRPIANLSGGEKTLASLALVFALHVFKPTPLYFMDEIDAALDFKNVSIVANYIQSKTQAAQFIVISLRNDMFELAHRLVGIYKTSNCTKSVAIDNKDLRTQAVRKGQGLGAPTPARGLVPATPATVRPNRPSVQGFPSATPSMSTPRAVV